MENATEKIALDAKNPFLQGRLKRSAGVMLKRKEARSLLTYSSCRAQDTAHVPAGTVTCVRMKSKDVSGSPETFFVRILDRRTDGERRERKAEGGIQGEHSGGRLHTRSTAKLLVDDGSTIDGPRKPRNIVALTWVKSGAIGKWGRLVLHVAVKGVGAK